MSRPAIVATSRTVTHRASTASTVEYYVDMSSSLPTPKEEDPRRVSSSPVLEHATADHVERSASQQSTPNSPAKNPLLQPLTSLLPKEEPNSPKSPQTRTPEHERRSDDSVDQFTPQHAYKRESPSRNATSNNTNNFTRSESTLSTRGLSARQIAQRDRNTALRNERERLARLQAEALSAMNQILKTEWTGNAATHVPELIDHVTEEEGQIFIPVGARLAPFTRTTSQSSVSSISKLKATGALRNVSYERRLLARRPHEHVDPMAIVSPAAKLKCAWQPHDKYGDSQFVRAHSHYEGLFREGSGVQIPSRIFKPSDNRRAELERQHEEQRKLRPRGSRSREPDFQYKPLKVSDKMFVPRCAQTSSSSVGAPKRAEVELQRKKEKLASLERSPFRS